MSTFDKLCSMLAIPIGALFMLLGIVGLFAGAKAAFTLPPVVGVLPFFLGWAMCVVPLKLWSLSNRRTRT